MFRKAPPVNSIGRSCLEIAGSDGIRSGAPMFYLTVWFKGSVAKLCWLLPSCDVISRSMVKSSSGEWHGCQVLENCIGGLSLCGKEELNS
jgi:hypothetical protein